MVRNCDDVSPAQAVCAILALFLVAMSFSMWVYNHLHPDSDGWEYCYSVYSEILPVNSLRWSLNPLNPLDVDYDPDADGWLDRDILDTPAIHHDAAVRFQ